MNFQLTDEQKKHRWLALAVVAVAYILSFFQNQLWYHCYLLLYL